MDGWRSKRPWCDPSKKPLFFTEKMLRLLEIFLVENSSPCFSKLVRVRGPNHYILLIGSIKPCNICYWHFLLKSFLSEILDDPFHQTKKGETNKTVLSFPEHAYFFWQGGYNDKKSMKMLHTYPLLLAVRISRNFPN